MRCLDIQIGVMVKMHACEVFAFEDMHVKYLHLKIWERFFVLVCSCNLNIGPILLYGITELYSVYGVNNLNTVAGIFR